jgi:chemotaxis protein methyltransferase CheR
MALNESIPDLRDWNITILATDINPHFLKKASQAVYGEWSFREASGWLKEKYFTKVKDKHYEVKPHIKKMVTFAHLNLAEDVYPSLLNNTNAMDIIFCRNVLMYFTPEHTRKAIRNLYRCLVDGGWLIVSSIETSPSLYSQFTTAGFHGLTLYRKGIEAPAVAAAPEPGKEFVFDTAAKEQQYYIPPPQPLPPVKAGTKAKAPTPPNSYEQALALYKQGLYADVTRRLDEPPAEGQPNVESASLLSRAYANQGKLGEALEWCQKAIASDRLNPSLYYLQATILEEKGDLEAAATSLKRALYLDQDFVLAHIALGNLSVRRQQPAQADRHFGNAVSLLKAYPEAAIIPESEGMTAGRLMDIINSTRYVEKRL